MAYYSGQVTSIQALLTILLEKCQNHGWNVSGSHIFKGNACVKAEINNAHITLQGGNWISNSFSNPAPNVVRLGALEGRVITYPIDYHLFLFENPNEVYLVIKEDINTFLWLAFGVSAIALPSTGVWLTATKGQTNSASVQISANTGGINYNGSPTSAAPFWNTGRCYNSYLNHGFDGLQWVNPVNDELSNIGGVSSCLTNGVLNLYQPSNWNSEAVMLPISCFVLRQQNKRSLALQMNNARNLRINHLEPEQILSLGHERWMVFPYYKKNSAEPNGAVYVLHSGTFGWAIRYDGP